jgi:CubicO group peptidase (beta-lactamase class C family)
MRQSADREAAQRLAFHVNDVLDSALRRERVVGAVIMIARDGEIIYRRAAGYADREQSRPMREDTIFRLASLTKPIVSAATLALVAKGLIALDDPVTNWLPAFRPPAENGDTPDILVRHLLTHTSGLDYGFDVLRQVFDALGISNGMDYPGLSMDEELTRLAKVPLRFRPGHGWNYSLSTDVLGEAIARAAGATLPEIVRQTVTGPLAMADTGFQVRDRDRLAVAYAEAMPRPVPMSDPHELADGSGIVRFSPSRILDAGSFASGGAGMAGTAPDFLSFLEALRAGGSPILERRHVELMMTDQLPEAVIYPSRGWRFGMGAAVLCEPSLDRSPHDIGTWRWGGGYGHDWFVNQKRRLTVVSLTNTALEGSDGAFPLNLRDAVYYALTA